MKTTTLIFMGLALIILPVYAQEGFSFTPRAGLNLSKITPVKDGNIKPGLNFGFSGDYMFSSKLGIELGAFYSMQGMNFKGAGEKTEHDYLINTSHDYLTFPLLAKFFITENQENGIGGLFVFGGGQADVNVLVDKVGYTANYEGQLMPEAINKSFGFSAVGGLGYVLNTGLMFSANLNYGLSNIAKDKYLVYDKQSAGTTAKLESRDRTYRNVVFQINFGYRFSFGNRVKASFNEDAFDLFNIL